MGEIFDFGFGFTSAPCLSVLICVIFLFGVLLLMERVYVEDIRSVMRQKFDVIFSKVL